MICPICGLTTSFGSETGPEMCAHHSANEDGWARGNRIMCDFFHRRKVPPRIPQMGPDDDFWPPTGEADAGI